MANTKKIKNGRATTIRKQYKLTRMVCEYAGKKKFDEHLDLRCFLSLV